jgi:hypothetical protein
VSVVATAVPLISRLTVPVGVAVTLDEFEATVIAIASLAPSAAVAVAGVSVVVEEASVEGEVTLVEGQAVSRLYRSTEPRPDASS